MANKPIQRQKYIPGRYDHYIPLHKKITNHWEITQIEILCENWGMKAQEVCYKLIHEGLMREVKKREEIEEIKKYK